MSNQSKIIDNITAVVCSYNAISNIEKCLESLLRNGITNIILVDANSWDGTREIAEKFNVPIVNDPGMGLALARNIGISLVKTKYTLNWGVDNVLTPQAILKMYEKLSLDGFSGASCMTYLMDTSNYFGWALDRYKKSRYFPGERSVIGTPTLFQTEVLINNPYDIEMRFSDDGDLCGRLSKAGHKFCIADTYVYEVGCENFESILIRWRMYGRSDYETFRKNSSVWSLSRKLKSIMHPLNKELIEPLQASGGLMGGIKILPFLTLITIIRYFSWLKHYFKN